MGKSWQDNLGKIFGKILQDNYGKDPVRSSKKQQVLGKILIRSWEDLLTILARSFNDIGSILSLHVQFSSKIKCPCQCESVYLTCFKNGLASEVISMYDLAYCSRFIVVATVATKGLTMSTRFGEDWTGFRF